jgi:predicted acyl esterase
VDPRGRSLNVCDGIVQLTDADPLTGTVGSAWSAAHRFGRGHRIRLQVAGGAFPRFARNPETGGSTRPPPTSCRRSTTSAWTRRTRRRAAAGREARS